MLRGGLSAGCFVAYVPQATRTPRVGGRRLRPRHRDARPYQPHGADGVGDPVCVSPPAPMPSKRRNRTAPSPLCPAWKTVSPSGADLRGSRHFGRAGAIYMTLTHNGHNALADSCNPRRDLGDREMEHGGLSALGKAAIATMNRAGMLVDVAHTSRDTMVQAAESFALPYGVDAFLRQRAVRPFAQHGGLAVGRDPRRQGGDPDHRGRRRS